MAESELSYMACEISWGTTWVDLNDGLNYKIMSEQTRDQSSQTYRKTVATSPVLGGSYLVHAVPEMVSEQIGVWVYGGDQSELGENYQAVQEAFSQYSYRIRWTFNEYREYWNCQLADFAGSRNHVWTHSLMAAATFTVPRYPHVETERI